MKALLLGDNGFLGQDFQRFNDREKTFHFETLPKRIRWPSNEFCEAVRRSRSDVIINCISTRSYDNTSHLENIHFDLPVWLASCESRILVNFSSDVADQLANGKEVATRYKEYAGYKLDCEHILAQHQNCHSIRTSIIGLAPCLSNLFFRSFFSKKDNIVSGHTNVFWSGVTSLQLYKTVSEIATEFPFRNGVSTLSSDCISIYELFSMINCVFSLKRQIVATVNENEENRCFERTPSLPSLQSQLSDLRKYFVDPR
jgi:dTDP-4-dehydrorhamnose reductase